MDFKQAQANSEKNLKTIIEKCWEDESFKQELIANPVKAIEKLSGQPLDLKGRKLIVTDQTDTSAAYINIPANPANMELSELELEAVAGGKGVEISWSFICVTW
ncbi:putative ribosomally synthesized peptide [Flavobacterium sp. 270]|uniref:NHLP leader peptide family RiPP precursor n=1 Tax=Flavobacterium sp. 270 TaxID=2512114 RepID=UPI0010655A01|nr:NHLP leader peptide family RiPP precursor [Flavobacterium sp. 270]TDW51699.1 putative ribosomally synthesized peptide [Flavobacterium sp. 270]